MIRLVIITIAIALAAYLAPAAWYLLNIAVRALPDVSVHWLVPIAGLAIGWWIGRRFARRVVR